MPRGVKAIKDETKERRKEERYAKSKNEFNPEVSGYQITSKFLTPQRIKIVFQEEERFRNIHCNTLKFTQEEKDEYFKFYEEYNEFMAKEELQNQYNIRKLIEIRDYVGEQISLLPYSLLDEMEEQEENLEELGEDLEAPKHKSLNPNYLYYEQFKRIYPPFMFQKMRFACKVEEAGGLGG